MVRTKEDERKLYKRVLEQIPVRTEKIKVEVIEICNRDIGRKNKI